MSLTDFGRRDQAGCLGHIDRALRVIGDDPQTTDLRLLLLLNKMGALGTLDRRADILATARQALTLAERVGTPRLGAIRTSAAEFYFETGQWDDAVAELQSSVGLPGPRYLSVMQHGLIALIAGHRGDLHTVKEHLEAVPNLEVSTIGDAGTAHYMFLARALAAERAGQPAQAVAELAECLDSRVAEGMAIRHMLLPSLVRLALATGDTATAAAAAVAAEEEAERERLPVKTAAAGHCRGLIEGDPAPLAAAAEYYRSTGRALHLGQVLENLAVVHAVRGELVPARAALREAVEIYTGLGAEWDILRADARARVVGVRRRRGGARRPATGWEALTPTEAKIAYLVAEGLSNPDIGARVFLSWRTVRFHMSAIMAKLQVHSRLEVANEAARHPPAQTVQPV